MNLPTLYSKDSHGELRMWRVSLIRDPIFHAVCRYGLVGGTIQESRKRCIVGSAPASCIEQAQAFCKSLWNKQKNKGYTENRDGEPEGIAPLPMLAQLFEKQKHKLQYPVIVQPKLDGFRCITIKKDGKVSCWSRSGKRFETTSLIEQELDAYMEEGECFDGELYKHNQDFNELSGSIRNISENNSIAQYHIYDYINLDLPQYMRIAKLTELFDFRGKNFDTLGYINKVPTFSANNEEGVSRIVSSFITQGYEGGIVRTLNNLYRPKYRSPELLKIKNFQDEEFEIISFTNGQGKEEGAIIWICITRPDAIGTSHVFNVRPKGTIKGREKWFTYGFSYIGKRLIVRFFGKSEKGIPRFPVGIRIKGDLE